MADAVPRLGEAFFVGVRVLDGLPLQPLRVPGDDPVADRAPVVLHVDPHRPGEPDRGQGAFHDIGQMVEGVLPGDRIRHIGVPEARVVERDEVEPVRQRGHQVAKLMRGRGEPREQ